MTRTRIRLMVILLLAAVPAALPVVGATHDDTLLIARVKGVLVTDRITRAHRITIETFQGIVQLSGLVNTAAEKTHAGELVAAVPGVVEVRNAIHVRQALADGRMERRDRGQVARALADAGVASNPPVELQ